MATHNGGKFLEEQLESLQYQLCLPAEVVVCDDASTDHTNAIIDSFAARAKFPVKHIRMNTWVGPHVAFMTAAKKCNGALIAFCDQDDMWRPRKLQMCTECFHDEEVVLAAHSMENFMVEDGRRISLGIHRFRNGTTAGSNIRPDVIVPGMCMVVRKHLVDTYEPIKQLRDCFYEKNLQERPEFTLDHWSHGHDFLFLMIARMVGKITFIPTVLADHRLHEDNLTIRRPPAAEQRRSSIVDRARLQGECESYLRYALHCEDNVKFFVDPRLEHTAFGKHAGVGVEYYRRWGTIYRLRARLYSDLGISDRTRTIAKIAAIGGYRGRYSGGLGVKSLCKDLMSICIR